MTDLDQMESSIPVRMEYQGLGIRFVSLVIDSLIISAIFGALATIFGLGMMRHGIAKQDVTFSWLYLCYATDLKQNVYRWKIII